MSSRSNADWLRALAEQQGEAREEALQDLYDFLLRATLVYLSLHRGELAEWSRHDVRKMAEDLTQDALLEIQESLDSFKGNSKFTTWAYRFAINRAASELRRRHYRNVSLDQLQDAEPLTFEALLQEERTVNPERMAERRSYLHLLRDIIEGDLNERQRAAIIGVHLRGLPMEVVAARLGLTRNALYKLLFDTRKRIKTELQARHLTEGDILAAFED
jgi:RNA polymerase sigma-70 factor (ECF subfamily)